MPPSPGLHDDLSDDAATLYAAMLDQSFGTVVTLEPSRLHDALVELCSKD